MDVKQVAFRWALKNAVEYGGKASVNAVMSKVLATDPALKTMVAEVKRIVEQVVEEVNSLPVEKQSSLLAEMFPDFEPKAVVSAKTLPKLPFAVHGKVVTRLPPEPSGHMHLGHAIAGLINEYYARMYDGKLWLRFEDTNPRKAELVFYESFRKGYRWLGIRWDYEKNNSDDMEVYYDYAQKLIEKGCLYACFCKPDEMHRQRETMTCCAHRENYTEANLKVWERALEGSYREGDVSFRLKGFIDSQNTALRDPVLFRVVNHPHPLHGMRYHLWPTYDFAAAVQDALCGVTHVLRSSEFAFRDELQNLIRAHLGLPNPVYVEFARFEFRGAPTSKRIIRELIAKGLVAGWDDPRLSTIEAVRRRGLLPETLREFTLTYAGVSLAKKEYDWTLIHSINRKLIDKQARRFFFVKNPVKLLLKNFQGASVDLPYHPSQNLGSRTLKVSDTVYISDEDAAGLKKGDVLRCKLLANVRILDVSPGLVIGEAFGKEPVQGVKIIQWVPEDCERVKVLRYGELLKEDGSFNSESLQEVYGLGEKSIESVKVDEVVQFERFGFCRRDLPSELTFIYCHE
ncbi:MAG: glutamate--tRNA ligase [Candidatus Caldarchaeum sp.]